MKNMDDMLKKSFLELDFSKPENEKLLNATASRVLGGAGAFTLATTHSALYVLLKKAGIAFGILAVLFVSVWYFYPENPTQNKAIAEQKKEIRNEPIAENVSLQPAAEIEYNFSAVQSENKKSNENRTVTFVVPELKEPETRFAVEAPQKLPQSSTDNFGSAVKTRDIPQLPKLTEDEIKENNRQKKKMIEKILKKDKSKYPYIPTGSFVYRGKTLSVQSFYLQSAEVTNLEYRTFLFDLIIQNRKEEFWFARPDQDMWNKRFAYSDNDPMREHYFSHEAYNDYPVVNITREGALMYCEWLAEETRSYALSKGKNIKVKFRLPYELEWAYAASSGKQAVYANGENSLQNEKMCYLVNYACVGDESKWFDSTKNVWVARDAKFIADGAFHTAKVTNYYPNSYGLFCMAGNVSEMVTEMDPKNPGVEKKATKGGNWASSSYFLQIEAEEELLSEINGPSPLLGFRPVLVFLIE